MQQEAEPPSGRRCRSAASSVSDSSRDKIGLIGDHAIMTRLLSMRPALEDTPPAAVTEFVHAGYHWRVVDAHAADIRAAAPDWTDLRACPGAELIKQNSHREVWRVRCRDRAYFAKLYHPRDPLSLAKMLLRGPTAVREWTVGRYAAAHGIAAVVPVATALRGFRGLGGPSILLTEAVAGVRPLNEYWLDVRHDRHRANLITELLARLIARAHQCGFQHGDMHPGNILVRPVGRHGEAFFVDLHNVRIGAPVSLRAAVANLAQLNQWFRRHATLTQRRRFLAHYLTYRDRYAQAGPCARNHRFEPRLLIARLNVRAEKHADRLWSKRDRRTRRTGRYFARVRPAPGWRGHVLLRSKHPAPTARAARLTYDAGQWSAWLRDPLAWVDPARHPLVKDSHTATLCRATLPTRPEPVTVLVKRPLARNRWKRLALWVGPSRNRRSWRMANMLLNRDLPTAQPLAVVERYALGLIRTDSIAFTDFITDALDLEAFLTRIVAALPRAEQRRVKDRTLAAVVRLLKAFHARRFVHRDLKAPNLLVNWPAPFRDAPGLTLIDMDGIRHVRRPRPRQQSRALVRLCVSLLHCPACTRTDRLRFLLAYLQGPGRSTAHWKSVWRRLDREVGSKRRAKEARRQWKLAHYGRE